MVRREEQLNVSKSWLKAISGRTVTKSSESVGKCQKW